MCPRKKFNGLFFQHTLGSIRATTFEVIICSQGIIFRILSAHSRAVSNMHDTISPVRVNCSVLSTSLSTIKQPITIANKNIPNQAPVVLPRPPQTKRTTALLLWQIRGGQAVLEDAHHLFEKWCGARHIKNIYTTQRSRTASIASPKRKERMNWLFLSGREHSTLMHD